MGGSATNKKRNILPLTLPTLHRRPIWRNARAMHCVMDGCGYGCVSIADRTLGSDRIGDLRLAMRRFLQAQPFTSWVPEVDRCRIVVQCATYDWSGTDVRRCISANGIVLASRYLWITCTSRFLQHLQLDSLLEEAAVLSHCLDDMK